MSSSDRGAPCVEVVERDVTESEFRRFQRERVLEAERCSTSLPDARRIGAVVVGEGGVFVGCGVVEICTNADGSVGWAYLAELFVEKNHRGRGLGRLLLNTLESRAYSWGVRNLWTNTAEYEAPGFYLHHNYAATHTLPSWYVSGHGNVAFRKRLEGPSVGLPRCAPPLDLQDRMPTQVELERLEEGFVEHGQEFGNPRETAERIGFVAVGAEGVTGYVSGLVRRRSPDLSLGPWCTLTDLFVSDAARGQGTGSALLEAMHAKLRDLGVRDVETRVPGHHDLGFMERRGYTMLSEYEDWYPGGVSRLALSHRVVPG